MAQLLALVPAYNEEERVGGVVTAARAHLPVLVVDDGSIDDTALRAQEAGATVLRQNSNQGKGAALRMGFRWALDAGYEAVLTSTPMASMTRPRSPSFCTPMPSATRT
jgi:glycosyltransferase involved in cell wall biosynthesis